MNLSRIQKYPVSRLVYSSFGFFGRNHGGALPGAWFVRAFSQLRIEEAAVRQTLHRMEKNRETESIRVGRDKLYQPSNYSWAAIDAGAEWLTRPAAEEAWDGFWTLIHTNFSTSQRVERERVGAILSTEGFARLANGVYLHPRDRSERVLTAVNRAGLGGSLMAFRGARRGEPSDAQLVSRLWDHRMLAKNYRRFLRRYGRFAEPSHDPTPPDAFALRFAVTLDFLDVAWGDPSLPPDLLPSDWPGTQARDFVRSLNDRLLPHARAFAKTVLDDVLSRSPRLADCFDQLRG